MNTQNYASLEACQRLVDAGIVLETDFYHYLPYPDDLPNCSELITKKSKILIEKSDKDAAFYPAPCFTEVWRELPRLTHCIKQDSDTKCVIEPSSSIENIKVMFNENPTDALIDLLIWVKQQKRRNHKEVNRSRR